MLKHFEILKSDGVAVVVVAEDPGSDNAFLLLCRLRHSKGACIPEGVADLSDIVVDCTAGIVRCSDSFGDITD